MCEELSNMKECDIVENFSNLQNNQTKQINIKQLKKSLIHSGDTTNKVNSINSNSINFDSLKDDNTLKVLPNKNDKCETQTKSPIEFSSIDLFIDLKKLSNKYRHKFKVNTSKDNLEINSKTHLDIVDKSSFSNKINLFSSRTSKNEGYNNTSAINTNYEKIEIDSIKQIKYNSEKRPKFHCSFHGLIHKNMLLKINSKSGSDKILNKSDALKTLDIIVLTSSKDEEELMSPTNSKRKMIHKESLEKNKYSKIIEPIFCCSRYGIIHNSMLNQLNNKK